MTQVNLPPQKKKNSSLTFSFLTKCVRAGCQNRTQPVSFVLFFTRLQVRPPPADHGRKEEDKNCTTGTIVALTIGIELAQDGKTGHRILPKDHKS